MEKQALVIKTIHAPVSIQGALMPMMSRLPKSFYSIDSFLSPRSKCETDESILQIIPYISLMNGRDIFVYRRGVAGGEERLHHNLSIGIGGHIEVLPTPPEVDLYKVLQLEARREYKEEIGQDYSSEKDFDFSHFIYDPSTEVGRVHLGLHCVVKFENDFNLKLENSLLDGAWVSIDELMTNLSMFLKLENWSRVVVPHIYAELI